MQRRKLAARREPSFEPAPPRPPMSAAREDRAANDDQPPRAPSGKSSAKSSRPRKRGSGRGGGGGRSLLRRLVYWCLVLCLWGALALGAVVAIAAASLPNIQSLTIPKRPPSIEIVGTDGKTL